MPQMNLADALPPTLRPWYQAARPRSLTATYAPLAVGGAIALVGGVFNLPRFLLALIGALMLQIASNLVNEYVDYTRGTDAHKVDGMGMVLTQGGLTPDQVRLGAIVTISLGAAIGLVLTVMSGLTLLWIGLVGVIVVITYTAGPFPLAYLGLGEIAVFICFGPLMVLGTYFAVSGNLDARAAAAGFVLGFPIAAILHANNMRDLEADKLANKRTLAVRFGLDAARVEYAILIYGAYVAGILLIVLGLAPWTTLACFVTLPEAIRLVQFTNSTADPKLLSRAQGMTAQFNFRFGIALAVGWLLFMLVRR
jgi:1,4-dihydroxy-2-naphthoate octaprenyltransferase